MKTVTKRLFLAVTLAAVALPTVIGLTACDEEAEEPVVPVEKTEEILPKGDEYDAGFLTSYSLGSDFTDACEQQGTMELFTYTTHSYMLESLPENAGKEILLEKTAQIYLPYGYDPEGEYDILYLLHGTGDEQEDFWLTLNAPTTENVLDNLIYRGICKPTIVVCPNYYSIPDDYEPYQGLSIISDPNADSWPLYFYQELRNELIPQIESRYATYAHGNVEPENLQATREHRAFAGLSRGSMTVVNSGMIHCTDLFGYFGSYSGIWADYDAFYTAIHDTFAEYPIYYWYNGTGTKDTVGTPQAVVNQIDFTAQVLEGMPDRFTDGENFALVIIDQAKHEYTAWLIDLYNSMLVFFQ